MAWPKGTPRPKGAGRSKGTPNKDPLQLEDRAKALGVDVFEVMAHFVAGNWKQLGYDNETYILENASGATKIGYTITPEMRLKAGTELMKYIYTQKKAHEHSTDPTKGFKLIIEDYSKK